MFDVTPFVACFLLLVFSSEYLCVFFCFLPPVVRRTARVRWWSFQCVIWNIFARTVRCVTGDPTMMTMIYFGSILWPQFSIKCGRECLSDLLSPLWFDMTDKTKPILVERWGRSLTQLQNIHHTAVSAWRIGGTLCHLLICSFASGERAVGQEEVDWRWII